MKQVEFTSAVKRYARELSFDLAGLADASDKQFDHAPLGHKPTEYLPGARSVVVGGIEVLDEILQTTPSSMYWKHYEQLNARLSEAADQLSRFLRRQGFRAMWFPESDDSRYYADQCASGLPRYSPSFSHIAAGLGARGTVGVLLTPQYGPRQRWISVITTAPLTPDPRFDDELCLEHIAPGSCGKCVDMCKTTQSGALKPWPSEGGVDMFRCNWVLLKSKVLACGSCIKVCPVGRK